MARNSLKLSKPAVLGTVVVLLLVSLGLYWNAAERSSGHLYGKLRNFYPALEQDLSTEDIYEQLDKVPPAALPAVIKAQARRRQLHYCEDSYNPEHLPTYRLVPRASIKTGFDMYVYSKGDIVSKSIAEQGGWENDELSQIQWALDYPLPRGLKRPLPMEQGAATAAATAGGGGGGAKAAPASEPRPPLLLDVGANVGWFMLNFAARGYRVAAFEAMRTNQQLIRSSLCLNRSMMAGVTLYPVALGTKRDKCFIFSGIDNRGDGVTLCGVADEAAANAKTPAGYALRGAMQLYRLDSVFDEEVKVWKMDVESYEPDVLEGASGLLARRRVWFITLEFSMGMLAGRGKDFPGQFLDRLLALPYRLSLRSFKGPWATAEEARLAILTNDKFHQNLYLAHKDLPL